MKIVKRIIAVIVSVVLFAGMFAFSSVPAKAETYGDYEYLLLDDGTVTITKYSGSDTILDIPAEINGYHVTSLGDAAFSNCSSLTNITIPDGVTSIGNSAFYGCSSLESITIPDGATTIGSSAFAECTSLEEVIIPDSVTTIGKNAFMGCTELKEVTIPASVTSIGEKAFGYASSTQAISGFVIKGYSGTEAKRYASDCGFTFVALDDPAELLTQFEIEDLEILEFTCGEWVKEFDPETGNEIEYYSYYPQNSNNLQVSIVYNGEPYSGPWNYDMQGKLYELTGEWVFLKIVFDQNQSYEHCWQAGNKYTVIGNLFGKTDSFEVTIKESPLESFIVSDMEIMEYTCGGWTTGFDQTTGTEQEYYNYIPRNSDKFHLSIIYDGNNYSGSMSYIYGKLFELTGEYITLDISDDSSQSYENRWQAGNHYEAMERLMGKKAAYDVTIKENLLESFEVADLKLGENTFGNWVTEYDSESGTEHHYYHYNPVTSDHLQMKIVYDGIPYSGSWGYIQSVLFDLTGETCGLYASSDSCQSYEERWILGNTYLVTAKLLWITSTFNVTIYSESGDYLYTINEDGTATITGYVGSDTVITIPQTIDGYQVTAIGDHAFDGCSNLTNVTIQEGVTRIGLAAFNNCTSLTNITIPFGVTSIGDSAFSYCYYLTNTTIPDSVTTIGKHAFDNCQRLTNFTIPENVTSIEDGVFFACVSLTSVIIPDGVTSIGKDAFWHCERLTSITLPDGLTSIGDYAFFFCDRLEKVYINDLQSFLEITYDGRWAHPANGGAELYIQGELATDIVIPDGVERINEYTFHGCDSLVNITIPNSVTEIAAGAFYNCSNLTTVSVPDSVTTIGIAAFTGCSNLTSVTLSDNVTTIERDTFSDCGLTSIIIPNSVSSIGVVAFAHCNNLTSVLIPDSVTSIGRSAFYDCINLKEVTIPRSVTSIDARALGYIDSNEKVPGFVIKGYTGSEAEQYALDNDIPFIALDGPADYTVVNDAILQIPDDLSIYTDESVALLNMALDAVVRDYPMDRQSEVDEMAQAIINAIAGLVEKPIHSLAIQNLMIDLSGYAGENNDRWLNVVWDEETQSTITYLLYSPNNNSFIISFEYNNGHYSGSIAELSDLFSNMHLSFRCLESDYDQWQPGEQHQMTATLSFEDVELGTLSINADVSVNTTATLWDFQISDITITEGTNGWQQADWNPELQDYTPEYYKYGVPASGDFYVSVTINGTKYEGTWNQLQNELPYECYINLNGQYYDYQWTVGEYVTTATIATGESSNGHWSATAPVNVSITANPLREFRIDNVEIIESTNGHWEQNPQTGERFWRYDIETSSKLVYHINYDGIVAEGSRNDVESQLRAAIPDWDPSFFQQGLSFMSDQTPDNPWTVENSPHTVTASLQGKTCTFTVDIVELPLEILEVKDLEISEGAFCGLGRYGAGFDDVFLNYTNLESVLEVKIEYESEIYSGTYSSILQELRRMTGQQDIRPQYITSQSPSTPWTVGNTYDASISILGKTGDFQVTIKESPFETIEVENMEIIENTNGSWYTYQSSPDDPGETYYKYGFYPTVTLTTKDGERVTQRTGYNQTIEYNGETFNVMPLSDQDSEHWVLGETYPAMVYCGGLSQAFEVTIIESPVESIVFDPSVYQCLPNSGHNFYALQYTVTFKDGTVQPVTGLFVPYNGKKYQLQFNDPNIQYGSIPEGEKATVNVSVLGYSTSYEVQVYPLTDLQLSEENGNLMLTMTKSNGAIENHKAFLLRSTPTGPDIACNGQIYTDKGTYILWYGYNQGDDEFWIDMNGTTSNVIPKIQWLETNEHAVTYTRLTASNARPLLSKTGFNGIITKNNIDGIMTIAYLSTSFLSDKDYAQGTYIKGTDEKGPYAVVDADVMKSKIQELFAVSLDFDMSLSSSYDSDTNTVKIWNVNSPGGVLSDDYLEVFVEGSENGFWLHSHQCDLDLKFVFDENYKIKGILGATPDSCEVVFVDVDGDTIDTVTVDYGTPWEEIDLPEEPEKEGYLFLGWANVPESVNEDMIVYAGFTADTTTLNFRLELSDGIIVRAYIRNIPKETALEDFTLEYQYYDPVTKTVKEYGASLYSKTENAIDVQKVAAPHMVEPVTVTLLYRDRPIHTREYSVRTYCENQIRRYENNNEQPELVAVCYAILDYGSYAQQYFGYRTDDLINGTYSRADEIPGITVPEAETVKTPITGAITNGTSTLDLQARIEMNFYFVPGDGTSLDDITVEVKKDGKVTGDYTLGKDDKGRAKVNVFNIKPADLEGVVSVTAYVCGEASYRVTTSPIGYVYRHQNDEKTLGILCKGVYNYYQTVSEYFGWNNQ